MLGAFEIEWGYKCGEDWIDIIDVIILLNYLTISLGSRELRGLLTSPMDRV